MVTMIDLSKIRGVVFDAVATILCPRRSIALVYQDYAAKYGIEADPQLILTRFMNAFQMSDAQDEANELRVSEASEQARWRMIVGHVFAEQQANDNAEQLFTDLFQHYAQPSSWQLYDDVAPCWQALIERGIRVGIGSNYDDRLSTVVAGHATLTQHRGLFISSHVGYRKPAVEFYHAIATDWQLQPNELLMIGDDPINDYAGATAAGWQALVIDRADRHTDLPRIRCLTELAERVRE